ncbi:hypothetical protein SCANM63S_06219 [Streptomyces canarius]
MVQVGDRGRHLGHRGEADTEMGVGVHGHPDPEGGADRGEVLGVAQSAPVVVVGEDDLHGTLRERLLDLAEGGDAHVGGERHVRAARHPGHAGRAQRRVLQVLQHVAEFLRDLQRSLHRPGAVGVEPQRVSGEGRGEGADGGDLLVGREHPTLELERAEAVPLPEPARLFHHTGRVERGTPLVRLGGDPRRVPVPLVEEVGAVLDRVPHLAAEQRVHGQAERLALGVEAGDLEGGQHGQPQFVGGLHPAQPARVRLALDPGGVHGEVDPEQAVHVHDRPSGEPVGQRPGQLQVLGVAVGLAEPGGPVDGDDLHDQPGGVRLVHALGVEQRRVGDQDRRQPHLGDGQVTGHGRAPTGSDPAARKSPDRRGRWARGRPSSLVNDIHI